MPCNHRVARERASEPNAAIKGAISIAEHETAEWQEGMAIHASAVVATTAAATAAAAREAAASCERREAEAGAREAAVARERPEAEEAIAKKDAAVRALEGALA